MKYGRATSTAIMTAAPANKEYAMCLRESIRIFALPGYDLLTQMTLNTESAEYKMWRVILRFKDSL